MPLTRGDAIPRIQMSNFELRGKKAIQIIGVDVKTLLLMLDNGDEDMLEQTLLHLNKVSHEKNVIKLLDREPVVQKLLEILVRSNVESCSRKLCLKLLTSLVKTDSAKRIMCSNVCYMQYFINILDSASDSVILEFCLYILAILTVNRDYCNFLLHRKNMLSFLSNKIMHSVDLDIQYNCLKIMENLLMHDLVQTRKDVPMLKIFDVFRHSRIKRLQSSSLNILYKLTELHDPYNTYGKELLTQFGSFAQAFDLVNIWPYEDQKIILLHLIATLPVQYVDIIALKKLLELSDTSSSALMSAGVNVLVSFCSNEYCQYYIDTMDIPHILVKHLMSDNIEVAHAACQGIRILCDRRHDFWREVSTDIAILNYLLKVMADKNVQAQYKARFGELLLSLMQNIKCCQTIVGIEDEVSRHSILSLSNAAKTNTLLDIAIQSDSEELTCVILRCVYQLVSCLPSHECIGQEQLAMIISYFESSTSQDDQKSETFLLILSFCLASPAFVNLFIDLQGLYVIDNYMKQLSGHRLLLSYGSLLINACRSDLAQVINNLNIFQWMNKHHLYQEPLWNRIIQSLLNINLSSKFAFGNALNFTDIVSEGFYAFQHLKEVKLSNFPDLDTILSDDKYAKKVVYVFTRDQTAKYKDNFIEKYISDVSVFLRSTSHSLSDHFVASKSNVSIGIIKVGDKIKRNIKANLEMIATYVINQMNGDGDETDDIGNQEHLEKLMKQQDSNVIPIGHVKCGLKFERCLLFKILCDVFGYRCTLVRSEYNSDCYNQVIIEDIDNHSPENKDISTKAKVFTVDLMSNPALLLPAAISYSC